MSFERPAPLAPGGDPEGFLLRDLETRECRYPIARDHDGTRFCAMPVERESWKPGHVNGCYCSFHVRYLERQPRVNATESEVA